MSDIPNAPPSIVRVPATVTETFPPAPEPKPVSLEISPPLASFSAPAVTVTLPPAPLLSNVSAVIAAMEFALPVRDNVPPTLTTMLPAFPVLPKATVSINAPTVEAVIVRSPLTLIAMLPPEPLTVTSPPTGTAGTSWSPARVRIEPRVVTLPP